MYSFAGNEPDADQVTRIVTKVTQDRYYHKSRAHTRAGKPVSMSAYDCEAWIGRFVIL